MGIVKGLLRRSLGPAALSSEELVTANRGRESRQPPAYHLLVGVS